MKSNPRIIQKFFSSALLFFALTLTALADDLISLDDLDGPGKGADFFNPYTFARDPLWILLPVFSLIILGLHLLPIPKRKSTNAIDQSRRFFRGISGEGTATGLTNPELSDDDLTPRPKRIEEE